MKPGQIRMRSIAVLLVISGIMLAALPAAAGWHQPLAKAYSPDSVIFGRTYCEWAAEWDQWAYSIPVSKHPLFDSPGASCSEAQSGPVWLLGGKFCDPRVPGTCDFTTAVRTCAVPQGKALFFPFVNMEASTLEGYGNTISELRQFAQGIIDQVEDVSLRVDGHQIATVNLRKGVRVQSPAFGFTLPAENLLKIAFGVAAANEGTYFSRSG